jgi:hypothetical protein
MQLQMNQVHCLFLISKKIQIPDIYNWKLEKQKLINTGYLTLEGTVTEQGKAALKKFNNLFDSTRAITTTDLLGADYKENIETFRKAFPVKAGNRKGVRSSYSQLLPKFEWFFKSHPDTTWEEVHAATALYLDSVSNQYVKNAVYFIKKMEPDKTWVSELASYIETYKEDQTSPQEDRFSGSSTLL